MYRVVDGKAVRTPVQLGYLSGELAEIRGGLAQGDAVVTTGKVALRDGALVEVIGGATAIPDELPGNADTAGY